MPKYTEETQFIKTMGDQYWRLNNLYRIIDKNGKKVIFKMKKEQEELFRNLHYRNVILKARQLGMTTFTCLLFLDECLFKPNIRAGIVAHNKDDAQHFFRDKIKYAYDGLPDPIKLSRPLAKSDAGELLVSHNENETSGVRVGTSLRSGTYHFLLISEYGKLCAKFPDKAREVRTGALNAIATGQKVIIESTAEGQEGHFYEVCTENENKQLNPNYEITDMDYRFFFFPWWGTPEYTIPVKKKLVVEDRLVKYFERLKSEYDINLTPGQKNWYILKESEQGDDMKREYPSTSAEAFEQSIEGAYYSKQISEMYKDGRLCSVPINNEVPVDTYWDLGVSDYMTIWFAQNVGREIHIVDYLEGCDEGLQWYIDELRRKGYRYGRHVAPHDIRVRELTTGRSRWETAQAFGINFDIAPQLSVDDGINAVRQIFSRCWFDETNCSDGVKRLGMYRKQWNARMGVWAKSPRHDENSHAADGFRYLAVSHSFSGSGRAVAQAVHVEDAGGWT